MKNSELSRHTIGLPVWPRRVFRAAFEGMGVRNASAARNGRCGFFSLGFAPYERHGGEKGPESDRQTCGRARADAQDDAQHESAEARRRTRADVSASAKIRERYESHWREPPAAHRPNPASAGVVFL